LGKPLNIRDYINFARTTAVYPDALEGGKLEIMYLALGLAGEAGEVANKTKKLYRDGDTQTRRSGIADELGDVFWYLVRICDALCIDPETLMSANAEKLAVRKVFGSLHGEGDSR
jgi:NTP pyrophosphatase (non-canonical NTP hydrolase)